MTPCRKDDEKGTVETKVTSPKWKSPLITENDGDDFEDIAKAEDVSTKRKLCLAQPGRLCRF